MDLSRLIGRLCEMMAEAGFEEAQRKAPHNGLDIVVYIDGVNADRLMKQTDLVASLVDPDVLIYHKSQKPCGYHWVEYYIRLRYEAIKDASNKLGHFMEMLKSVLVLVAERSKVTINAVERWDEITATIYREVMRDSGLRFHRDEAEGTVIC